MDTQAILNVLRRRRRTYDKENQHLDLNATDLRNADLEGVDLRGALNLSADQLLLVKSLYEVIGLDKKLKAQIMKERPHFFKEVSSLD